ncbi:recombinase family protein [Mycolicibacterium chlorophenolicum]
MPHLLTIASDLQVRGVELRSLTEVIDTTTPGGRLIFHVFGAVAEVERAIADERTAAGIAAARAARPAPPEPRSPAHSAYPDLAVPSHDVGVSRLIGGWPPSAL